MAVSPSSSSILISWLYLASLSVLDNDPVLIWPVLHATDRSAIVVSSVSPERCEITAVYPALFAISTESSVSVNVPIWFTFTSIELPTPSFIPFSSNLTFVTNMSSPTSCTLLPNLDVSCFHPSQSSSDRPSSLDERFGATPPSSPTAVLYPFSWSIPLRE